ncbi:Tetratricopeptide TPR_2 [Deinococcus marmoris]|uniref:Tetratricopeptide TPR_2 n=1 Tax=Deinococcus marmoris TaxID=249408 RepID=A0A1U7NSI7_9DEIO|nr:Tetratricopeptide TPR_2 [Deinococcus marmoris]
MLWLRALRGLGKSALLRAAALGGGTLLVGQSGQPYQTLLPLAPDSAPTTDEGWLRFLIASKDALLLDDWEAADPESRRVLLRLAQSRAGGPLVFSSRERSPLGSGSGLSELPLRPLPPEALSAGEYAQTGGLPALVAALHAQESLSDTLATLLSPLSPQVRQVLACLALQDQPAPQVTRRALELDPEALAGAQETLGLAGLWQSGTGQGNIVQGGAGQAGIVAARSTVLVWLAAQPSLEAEVLILLAPQVPPAQALPLYLRAQALTGSSTLPGFQPALAVSALALLDAEQESEAETLLAAHARTPETWLLHARALDTLGRGPEALKRLEGLPLTPDVQAVRGLILWSIGRMEEARQAAEAALTGDLPTRARGHMVLGNLALSAQDFKLAKASFLRACGLFRLLGDNLGYLRALCQQAVAMTELGDDLTDTMQEIRPLSAQNPQAQTLSNIGWLLERQNEPQQALDFYRQAAQLAQTRQQATSAALAWNNVGTVEQQLGRLDAAEQAYQTAITYARHTGETHTLAMVLGNLGELKENLPLIEEALELLRGTGQEHLIAYFEEQRLAFMARSGGN